MKGKLIVLESGVDGAGKETQAKLLEKSLINAGVKTRRISFPAYESPSSALVRMYLNGSFGLDPEAINPYAASTFYSVDRLGSYLSDWKKDLEDGVVIILDRYTSSNMIYQGAKLSGEERRTYLSWLDHHEHEICGLPRPDLMLFLDVEPEVSKKLREGRTLKVGGERDIHEENDSYMRTTCLAGREATSTFDWKVIACDNGSTMYDIDVIHQKIYQEALTLLHT